MPLCIDSAKYGRKSKQLIGCLTQINIYINHLIPSNQNQNLIHYLNHVKP